MKNILLNNINLVTYENNRVRVDHKDKLIIRDGKISDRSFGTDEKYEKIECGGRVAMSGHVNFHHHIYSQLAKGMPVSGDLSNFYNILDNMWWKLDKVLFEEAIEYSAHMAAIECLKNGVSTVFDHHASFGYLKGSLKKISDILESYGLNSVMCFEISDRNGQDVFINSVEENIDYYNSTAASKNKKAMIGLHAPFTLSDKSLDFIRKNTPEEAGFHFHIAEDILDVMDSWKTNSEDILSRMIRFNMINSKTILGHCNHLTRNQFEQIADLKAAIAHNPASNMNNAVGILNYHEISDLPEINFLPGTDGMTANIISSIKTAFLAQRHINRSAEIGFDMVNRMLLDGKRFAEKYFENIYSLKEGDTANICVMDYIPYTPLDSDNFLGHFIYGITESRCYALINERLLVNSCNVLNVNESELCKNSLDISRKLWEKL